MQIGPLRVMVLGTEPWNTVRLDTILPNGDQIYSGVTQDGDIDSVSRAMLYLNKVAQDRGFNLGDGRAPAMLPGCVDPSPELAQTIQQALAN